MNIADCLDRAARFFPDRLAIRFEGASYSYQAVADQAARFANALRALGVARGDRVALLLPNIPEFVFAYHGIQKIGAIAVSLNAMLTPREVEFILDDAGACAIVTTAALRPNVPDRKLPRLRHVILAEGEPAGGTYSMADLCSAARAAAETLLMERADHAAILYTSGTTGFPKGAILSHGNVVSNVHATVHSCGIGPDDRLLLFLPLFHCFGQNFIMNAGITAGATLVMQRRFVPDESLDLIEHEAVTMFFGVPTNYIVYLNEHAPRTRLDSVRYYFTAAAKMPEEIAAAWTERYGHCVYEGYGLTETSPMASYNHPVRHKPGSIGTPIENVEMKIVDASGNAASPGEWGEILIRGPNVMTGYWRRPDDTARVIRDGWFHSGDIGAVDEEGYFFVCDRVNDMVITAGFNVYPAEIENVIYAHPAVAEVAVYGVPDATKGEIAKASVVVKPGHDLAPAALVEFCRARLASYKVPRIVEFTDRLPKNPTGKILKRVLRDRPPTAA